MSQAPVRVTPMIKFARWCLLTVSAMVPFTKTTVQKETKVREIEAQQNIVREAKLAEEKKSAAAEMKALEDLSKTVAKKA